MNVREKLVELIEEARLLARGTLGSMNRGFGDWYADYLIAHGVTVSEWISVKDRLPEEKDLEQNPYHIFLVASSGCEVWEAVYNPVLGYFSRRGFRLFSVTHWMPLPKPPKEDSTDD